MGAKLENAEVTTMDPHFIEGEFTQGFVVRSKVPIAPGGQRQIMKSLLALFQRTIEQNRIKDYRWPPTRVEIEPESDLKGFGVVFGTPARHPLITVVHRPSIVG